MEIMDKGLCTKMGADSLVENTPNATKIFSPIFLPKPKSLGFSKKSSLWVSVVRALHHILSKTVTATVLILGTRG